MIQMWDGPRGLVANIPPGDIQWLEPPYRSVDPVKDAAANKILVELGVKSRAEVIRERGKDPDTVLAEVSEEADNAAQSDEPEQSEQPDQQPPE